MSASDVFTAAALRHADELSFRDRVALEAMRLLIQADWGPETPSDIAAEAYAIADAMVLKRGPSQ